MKRCVTSLLSCFSILSLYLAPPAAATVYVDADAPGPAHDGTTWATAFVTVAQGLSTAKDGDEVWVAEGVYVENVTLTPGVSLYGGFAGSEIERSQRDVAAHGTILDGNKVGTVVTVPENAPATTILDGFAIRNGSAGGVMCRSGSSPVIRNNRITANEASSGAGVYCIVGRALVEGNTIENNAAVTYGGGGLLLAGGAPIVRGNTIRGNVSDSSGGGIEIVGNSGPPSTEQAVVDRNNITRNQANSHGGGIACIRSEPLIIRNRIERNRCPYPGRGGGISLGTNSISDTPYSPRVIGNVIRSNELDNIMILVPAYARIFGNVIAASGVGILSTGGSHVIVNNTIVNHSGPAIDLREMPESIGPSIINGAEILNNIVAYNENGIWVPLYPSSRFTATLRANCIYASPDDFTLPGDNLYVDPQLADPARGDYHILPTSPCRDAGATYTGLTDMEDLDGQPRVQGSSVDIGADESDGTVPVVSLSVIHVKPDGNDANDGSTWQTARRTVQGGIDAVDGAAEVWVAGGTYRERVIVPPLVHLYGGFAGTETARGQRGTQDISVLDGGQGGTVVTVNGTLGVNTLDGFTITNGSAANGGGVRATSVTLTNCVVTGNRADNGGGLQCYGACILRDNDIRNNTAARSAGGLDFAYGQLTAERNAFVANSGGYAGGLAINETEATLRNNLFAGNQGSSAGGIQVSNSSITLTNNTLVANTSPKVGALSATLWRTSFVLVNNVFSRNTGSSALNAYRPTTLRNNCFFEESPVVLQFLTDFIGKDGNIAADPLFVDASAGDYRLQAGSPCVDSGDDLYVDQSALDIDGHLRIQGAQVDMGAYEFAGPTGYRWWDVVQALRAAGGLDAASPESVAWLSAAAEEGKSITLALVVQIARKASGLDANP